MRLPETDAVFVVGLLEGEFPQTPGDQGLLTHADRDMMMENGAELPDCFANKVLREGICFYKALTVARKYLWLSWPSAAHGEDTAPASAALAQVLQYLAVPPYAPTAAQLAAAPAAALDVLGLLSQQPGAEEAAAVPPCGPCWMRTPRWPPDTRPCAAPPIPPVRNSGWRTPKNLKNCWAVGCASAPPGLKNTRTAHLGIFYSISSKLRHARRPSWPRTSAAR